MNGLEEVVDSQIPYRRRVMELKCRHIDALKEAEKRMICCDFCPYLDLKNLFLVKSEGWQQRVRPLFKTFYKMGPAHLGPHFEDAFFRILFCGTGRTREASDFERAFAKPRLKASWLLKSVPSGSPIIV